MYMEQNKERPVKNLLFLPLNALVGFFFGLGILLLLSTAVCCEWLSEETINVCPAVSALLACTLAAYLSGKLLGRGLLFGIIHGLLHYALSYFMGLFVFLRLAPSEWSVLLLVCCIIGGIIGGILSAIKVRFKKYRVK